MTLEAASVVGAYRVDEMLGRGAMGVVYRATHVDLGRDVALKILAADLGADPEFAARFRREGRLQASLEQPNVVTVYEAGESEHGLYLAMRLVRGATLAELIRRRALYADRALHLLRQVADALDAAHAAGLVHRDVKPQNVLVGDADDAYLGDFGLTRRGRSAGITGTGRLLGTVSYLAPEVIRGAAATPASDRYALAAVLFECLTGTVGYPRATEAATLYAHTSEPPPHQPAPPGASAGARRGLRARVRQGPLGALGKRASSDGRHHRRPGKTGLGPPRPPGWRRWTARR